jgi:GNAT superfamily N-acetyltransferase
MSAKRSRKARASGAKITVRRARLTDAEPIACLCGQLGYPSTANHVARRLRMILRDQDHAVFVAGAGDGSLAGWAHIGIGKWLVSDCWAEVGGLVVDQQQRGRGIGALLMERAEGWARGKGVKMVRLRSNVVRQEAHRFYQKLGYEIAKTQHAFQKSL